MPNSKHIVVATDLSMEFSTGKRSVDVIKAVDRLNLEINRGELTALVGPDGAGKTTFQRLMAGLYVPTGGQLTVLGFDVATDPQAIQTRISYMPQRFGLYEDLSVQENLDLYADLHNVSMDVRAARFQRLLKIMDLTRFTARPAGKLSGGMKQKLGLSCCLVRSPELLLLDEPSVGVDPLSRRDLWEIILQLVKEENLSVVISTSYMDEAERCANVNIMYQGKILAQGSPEALTQQAAGLTWRVTPSKTIKARRLQSTLLENKQYIVDAVSKGDSVNFIRATKDSTLPNNLLPKDIIPTLRQPELEDAFMLILHHAQKGDETIASVPIKVTEIAKVASDHEQNPVVIEVKDLVRTFGDFTAVASTSFAVERGEIFGLLGPNGAGKTTTFRMLCGLLPATSGSLQVAGMNLRMARAQARVKIGYVSQKFALYGNLTVLENLNFFGGAYGLYGKKLKMQIEKVLAQFDLNPSAKSDDLPNGFKQRLSMATALLHEPEIVFLDEPTSGIDPLARRLFWVTIGELADRGITIIITTHFMEEAEYCDRIAIQDAGKMLALGTPYVVRQQAGTAYSADMNSAFIAIVENARNVGNQQGGIQ